MLIHELYGLQQIQQMLLALYRHPKSPISDYRKLYDLTVWFLFTNIFLVHVRSVQERFTQTGEIVYCCTKLECPGRKLISNALGKIKLEVLKSLI